VTIRFTLLNRVPSGKFNRVNRGMPFHVGAKGVNNNEGAHAHCLDVPSPSAYGFSGSVN